MPLFYTSALRKLEAFDLLWSDIDFESKDDDGADGYITVSNRTGTDILPPFKVKDKESRRIPIPKFTVDLLTQWQQQQGEGIPFVLFTNKRWEIVKDKWNRIRKTDSTWKSRWMENNTCRDFKKFIKRAGIQPVGSLSLHDLRKACCCNWCKDGWGIATFRLRRGTTRWLEMTMKRRGQKPFKHGLTRRLLCVQAEMYTYRTDKVN